VLCTAQLNWLWVGLPSVGLPLRQLRDTAGKPDPVAVADAASLLVLSSSSVVEVCIFENLLKDFRTEPNSSVRSSGIVREEVCKICLRNEQI
jgi:hypothetical protein